MNNVYQIKEGGSVIGTYESGKNEDDFRAEFFPERDVEIVRIGGDAVVEPVQPPMAEDPPAEDPPAEDPPAEDPPAE